MKLLFLASWFPYPPDNGNKIRVSNLLRALAQHHRVTLVSTYAPDASPALADAEQEVSRVVAVPGSPRPPRDWRRIANFVLARPQPGWDIAQECGALRQAIAREVQSGEYALVVANELSTAIYANAYGRLPALLEDIELGGYRRRLAPDVKGPARWRGMLYWWKLKRVVARLLKRFAACTVVSDVERRLVQAVAPGFAPIEIVPNCIDYPSYATVAGRPQPNVLVFSGSLTFNANYEAVVFFLKQIYPRVKQRLPGARFLITGRHNNLPLPIPPGDAGVELTGYVNDVRPVIADSWISVVPLLTGGGTRFKILEAMALGTPVVSTSKGAEGLDVRAGQHLLIADEPQAFADAIVRLCQDIDLRTRLTDAARALIVERYDWSAATQRFLGLIENIVKPK